MFCADFAGEDELLAEGLTGSVSADGGVAGGDVGGFGEGFEAALGEVDLTNDLAVGGLHGGEDRVDAGADGLLGGWIDCGFGEEVDGPLLESTVFDGAVAEVVDDGVAKDAIEPGGGRLAVAKIGNLLDSAKVGGLDDVLGGGWGFDTRLYEAQKLLPAGDETFDGGVLRVGLDCGHERWRRVVCQARAAGFSIS
jgi:hypothetical protein